MDNKFDLREWWKNFNRKNTYVLSLVIFIVTTVAYLVLQPNAFEEGVLSRLLTSNFRTWLPVILLAIGQTIVMLGGGLDLSSGAMVSLFNVILAISITSYEEPWFNLVIVLGVVGHGFDRWIFEWLSHCLFGFAADDHDLRHQFCLQWFSTAYLTRPMG